ncbi:MAG TPA: hypothetical protein IAA30_08540 [Candidatus Treponema faecavium]|nr:hypothetical protein [Candidatus Treponema faecavium]
MNEVVVYLGFASALFGFVAVFVKIGVLKGKFTEQLKQMFDRTSKLEAQQDLMEKELYGLQKESAGFMAKVDTSFSYIKDMLERLERKIDAGGGDAAPK